MCSKNMKAKTAVGILAAALIILSGCSGTGEEGNNGGIPSQMLKGYFRDGAGRPISGGAIRFDVDNVTYQTVTAADGSFSIDFGNAFYGVGEAPRFIAGTAKAPGYKSQTLWLRASNGGIGSVPLAAQSHALTDKDVEVSSSGSPMGTRIFHLGDGDFTGSTNSQLQVSSSGISATGQLSSISEEQINRYPAGLCFTFDARGIETRSGAKYRPGNIIKLNDQVSELQNSPSDGSFGRQTHCFTNVSGGEASKFNGLTIQTDDAGTGDYDDFEVINITGLFSDALPPKPLVIEANRTSYRVGDEVVLHLKDISTQDIAKVVWNFGDGRGNLEYSDASPVSVFYDAAGSKTVTATIFSSSGSAAASASLTFDIEVLPKPSNAYVSREGDCSVFVQVPSDFIDANIRVTWPDDARGEVMGVSPPDYASIRSVATDYAKFSTIRIQYFSGSSAGEALLRSVPRCG